VTFATRYFRPRIRGIFLQGLHSFGAGNSDVYLVKQIWMEIYSGQKLYGGTGIDQGNSYTELQMEDILLQDILPVMVLEVTMLFN